MLPPLREELVTADEVFGTVWLDRPQVEGVASQWRQIEDAWLPFDHYHLRARKST